MPPALCLALLIVACTSNEKWGYEINNKEYIGPAGNSAYKEVRDSEVVYNNNLLSINETLSTSEHKRYWGAPMGDVIVPAKTSNTIVGPCQFADKKNWKCGNYRMFSGQLSYQNQNMIQK